MESGGGEDARNKRKTVYTPIDNISPTKGTHSIKKGLTSLPSIRFGTCKCPIHVYVYSYLFYDQENLPVGEVIVKHFLFKWIFYFDCKSFLRRGLYISSIQCSFCYFCYDFSSPFKFLCLYFHYWSDFTASFSRLLFSRWCSHFRRASVTILLSSFKRRSCFETTSEMVLWRFIKSKTSITMLEYWLAVREQMAIWLPCVMGLKVVFEAEWSR